MHSVIRDIRFAARSLLKSPGLTIVSVLALGIGIGLTTTMFSIIYGAMIRGLPFPESERIVAVSRTNPSRGVNRMPTPIHDYQDLLAAQRSFAALGGSYSGTVNVSGTERAERFSGAFVTASMFEVTGVRPLVGRTIMPGEDRPGGERVAVLGYDMWQNRYGGDPGVVGKVIRANGVPYTVVGVMPKKYDFPDNSQIWLPLQLDAGALKRGDGQWLNVVGRLKDGVSLDAANADVAAVAKRIAAEYKETNEGVTALVEPYIEREIGAEPRRLLVTMLGAVALVLLIACANVANLLLDRAAHRTKEIGVRTALGASRSAVMRQFLAEALVLSGLGALVGVGIAHLGLDAFTRAIADSEPPSWLEFELFPPVLVFAAGTALLASLASGLLPAWQSSRADISEILKDESRGASSLRVGRLSRSLVVFSIALSCTLLVAAGLMIRSVVGLRTVETGFDTKGIFTARMGFPSTYTDSVHQKQFFDAVLERAATIPGVQSASFSSGLPGSGYGSGNFAIDGVAYAAERDHPNTFTLEVSPGFFDTFGVAAVEGRAFSTGDREGALPVAIVDRQFVAKHFHGASPIGKRVRMGGATSKAPWMTIVGVVPTMFAADPDDPRPGVLMRPFAQNRPNFASLAIRTASPDPLTITSQVRDVVASADADIPLYWVYSMEQALARPTWFIRVFGTMFMIFGFIALFLAAVGLYAVMAFSVSRRTREVGIRMALGAQAGDVIGMIFRQGFLQLAVGMTIGLTVAFFMSRLVAMLLVEVKPHDPLVFGSVIAVLAAAGMLACFVPARRATRVDPLTALRAE